MTMGGRVLMALKQLIGAKFTEPSSFRVLTHPTGLGMSEPIKS
jgi:hypothetical protein